MSTSTSSNLTLARAAYNGMYNTAAYKGETLDTESSWCQRVGRKIVASVYGGKFARAMNAPSKREGSAIHAAHRWIKYFPQFCITPKGRITKDTYRPGDIIYKTIGSGSFGHIGMVTEDLRVAENSSTKVGRLKGRGALGFRTLQEFGALDSGNGLLIVRLPDPQASAQTTRSAPVSPPKPTQPAVQPTQILVVTVTPHATGTLFPSKIDTAKLESGHFTADAYELAIVALANRYKGRGRVNVMEFLAELEQVPYNRTQKTDPATKETRYELYI